MRIGRQGDRITLRPKYHTFDFITDDVLRDTALLMSDWRRLQGALIRASFWALDVRDACFGLDGAR